MGRVTGETDYSPEIKIEAVQCYLRQFPECICDEAKRKKCLPRNDRRRNADGFTKFESAHEDLKRRAFVDPGDSARVKAMTIRQFRSVVRRHGKGVLEKGLQYSRTRKRPEGPLSRAELRDAAKLLGTPANDDEGFRYYRTADDAYERCARFRVLCDSANVSPDTLAKRLLKECPDILQRGKLDQKETLSDNARKLRTQASDVWGGREVWRVSKHPDKDGGGVVGGRRNVYWHAGRQLSHQNRWPYYNKYSFLMDAGTVSTGDPVVDKKGEVGYYRVDEIFPPEEVRAAAPLGAQLQLMFYIVVHKSLGIVCGPDFMYTGSKTSTSKNTKHVTNFLCWCACPDKTGNQKKKKN